MKKILFLLLITSINLSAQTNISGGNVSGTWTLSGSPYLIEGNILIPNDSTLSIEPGVIVEFQGKYKLFCNGTVIANGTADQPILFTVPVSNITEGWLGIKFEDTPASNAPSSFRNCTFQYGKADQQGDVYGGAIYFKNYSNCTIDSCSFLNNFASNGGGAILCYNSSPAILNSLFDNNDSNTGGDCIEITNSTSLIEGNTFNKSGLYCYISFLTIRNNTFSNCPSQGAITCHGTNYSGGIIPFLIIQNNVFDNNFNQNGGGGGAILLLEASAKIEHNIFKNNSTETGGGAVALFRVSSQPSLTNSVIVNNLFYENFSGNATGGTSRGGGAINCYNTSPLIINNTICNNNTSYQGGAIFCTYNADPTFYNNIIFNNKRNSSVTDNIYLEDNNSDPNFYNNDLQGGLIGINSNGNPFIGAFINNIDSAPEFADETAKNFSLTSISSCVNGGRSDTTGLQLPIVDLANNPRIFQGIIDIGAYEFQENIPLQNNLPDNEAFLYPNPVKDVLHFGDVVSCIRLYTVDGRIILKEVNAKNIDLKDLEAGTYICEIVSDNKIYKTKLIKNKK